MSYRIRVTALPFGQVTRNLDQPTFVLDNPDKRFGSWFTFTADDAKAFKRRSNAEKWLTERPLVQGVVEALP